MANINSNVWWDSLTQEERDVVCRRATANTIVRLQPSDVISESMNKINYNFDSLLNQSEVDEYKYTKKFQDIQNKLDELERNGNSRDADLANGITSLNDKIDGMSTSFDIQAAIDEAISNAQYDTQQFITRSEFDRGMTSRLGEYVRSVDFNRDLSNLRQEINGELDNYVTSYAFDIYTANAANSSASAKRIVANSTFYKLYNENIQKYCLVYLEDNKVSNYESLDVWYRTGTIRNTSTTIKSQVDALNEGLENDDVLNRLIDLAEDTFKTIYTEMSLIEQKVTENEATTGIISTVKRTLEEEGNEDAKDITAAIFVTANRDTGSEIVLKADKLNFEGYAFQLSVDRMRIDSTNFSVTSSGDVIAKSIVLQDNVVSHNMEAYNINAHNITLEGKNGKTYIGDDGILHAFGAEIEGDVTATKFNAKTETKPLVSDGSTIGTYSIGSSMDAEHFLISSKTKKTGESTERDAKIYITILPELPLDADPNIPSELVNAASNDGNKLIGVPVLCFEYNNVPYYLTPGAWRSSSGGTILDNSNMYFTNETSIYKTLAFNGTTTSHYELHSDGNYYVFNPYKKLSGNRYNITTTDGKKYEFDYDFGDLSESEKAVRQSLLDTAGLTTGVVGVNLSNDFIYSSQQNAPIDADHVRDFKNQKYTGDFYQLFGDVTDINYGFYDDGSSPVNIVPTTELNPSVITYLNNKIFDQNYNAGSWQWNYDLNQNASVLQILKEINPFRIYNNSKKNLLSGTTHVDIIGAYKVTYDSGIPTTVNNKQAYGKCSYTFNILYSSDYQIQCSDRNNELNYIYHLQDICIEVTYATYTQGFSGNDEDKINGILNTTSFTDGYQNMDINIYITARKDGHSDGTVILTYKQL